MNQQKRPLGLFAATLVIAASFGAGSCELFEDPVTEEMAIAVTAKAVGFLKDFYNGYNASYATGASITDTVQAPVGDPFSLAVTVTKYTRDDAAGFAYEEEATFTEWYGDGSSPYMELTGTVTFTSVNNTDCTIKGALKVANTRDGADEDDAPDITIDSIAFDLSIDDQNWGTGTVEADGRTFTWTGSTRID